VPAVLLITALTVSPTSVALAADQYKGRLLVDVLRALQASGLRIVYSSATVTPDLRVQIEPRGTTARQQLDEVLAQHGLTTHDGPGGTIQVVRDEGATSESATPAFGTIEGWIVDALTAVRLAGVVVRVEGEQRDARTDARGRFLLRRVRAGTQLLHVSMVGYTPESRAVQVTAEATISVTVSLSRASPTHSEYVSVRQTVPYRKDQGIASETSLDRSQLERIHGSLADDPIRSVHAFPSVTPVDEFHTEFAVRGSPFRQVDVVVDGVSMQWLKHTAYGRGATGSLPMFSGQVLEEATLRAGAYPHKYSDRLGPQLDLTLREGARTDFRFSGTIGGTSATLLAEGPLGEATRGSWLVAFRQSYLEWPTLRGRTAFGFGDGLAKLVYDVRPSQQVALTVLGGISSIDGEDNLAANELGNGMNRASVVSVSWRSMFGPAMVLTQRASVMRQHFLNKYQNGRESDRGANEEVAYRADFTRPITVGLLQAGVQVGRTMIDDVPRAVDARAVAGSSWLRAGYAHFVWAATPTLTLSPGVRVSASTIQPYHAVTRWLLGEWTFRPGWTLNGSVGVSQQLPELRNLIGDSGSLKLRPERADQVDIGIERQLTHSIRWRVTVFGRQEDNILRDPDNHPRLVGDTFVVPERERYANALQGTSRGIELLVDRRSPTGLSGWAAYSYGKTRYIDAARGEAYWGDFDQRHTVNLFGTYRFSPRTSVGATFRAGSNFPIPGYFAARHEQLFVASARNQVRLVPYARVDFRADRECQYFGRRFTLFVEVLNALNRRNVGLAEGSVNPATGEAIGFTDTLSRRRASGGVVFEF
jgi:CarboxypepD_reg-like domain